MDVTGAVPRELRDQIEQELQAGERIRWIDTPIPRLFTPRSIGLFLFAIPWTGFAVFWTASAAWMSSRGPAGDSPFNFFPLFGLPFILIGLGLLSSPFWLRRRALRTVYAITDRRAISIEGGWSTTVRSYGPANLQEMSRKERKDGSGDLILSHRAYRDSDGHRRTEELGFLQVREVREVEKMLRQLAATAQPGAVAQP